VSARGLLVPSMPCAQCDVHTWGLRCLITCSLLLCVKLPDALSSRSPGVCCVAASACSLRICSTALFPLPFSLQGPGGPVQAFAGVPAVGSSLMPGMPCVEWPQLSPSPPFALRLVYLPAAPPHPPTAAHLSIRAMVHTEEHHACAQQHLGCV